MNTIDLKEPMVIDEPEGLDEAFIAELTELPEALPIEEPTTPKITIASSYTVDEQGLLNNFAIMPPMYVEEPASTMIGKPFPMQIIVSLLIVSITLVVALLVS
ncbi:hypothetical protein [Pseudanabaena sp. Chao 1811]|uniref:hypothetical protein n=1 Tax=Pseudanabaena sp. Chao 1811 TaxID=2963092 RepID=UPI0022F3CFB0|nr:hypothetical protein [Pseudanabaena sp. Chao 1811]